MKQIILLLSVFLLYSCGHTTEVKKQYNSEAKLNNTPFNSLKKDSTQLKKKKLNHEDIKPVFGYRFQIKGDFDGDGKMETLQEHFYSRRDKKETNKYFTGIDDVWILYDSVHKRDCISYMISNNHKLDTIPVWGFFGPIFLRNEGDLDSDGGDEISYVPSLEQQSSVNSCHILSFKKGKWKELYKFVIREWQLPPLPEAGKTYGLFGMDGNYTVGENDTINQELLKQYNMFPGFITKLRNGKIKVKTFTPLADDTTVIVDLRKLERMAK